MEMTFESEASSSTPPERLGTRTPDEGAPSGHDHESSAGARWGDGNDGHRRERLPSVAARGAGLPTPWVKVQLDGSDPFSAQMAPLIEQMSSSFDLEQSFEPMAAASSIEQGEADVIDGVDVTKYVVTVDVGEMPSDMLGGAAPEDLPFDEVTYTLWVDGDDLLVATQMILADTSDGHHDLRVRRTCRDRGTTRRPGHRREHLR